MPSVPSFISVLVLIGMQGGGEYTPGIGRAAKAVWQYWSPIRTKPGGGPWRTTPERRGARMRRRARATIGSSRIEIVLLKGSTARTGRCGVHESGSEGDLPPGGMFTTLTRR